MVDFILFFFIAIILFLIFLPYSLSFYHIDVFKSHLGLFCKKKKKCDINHSLAILKILPGPIFCLNIEVHSESQELCYNVWMPHNSLNLITFTLKSMRLIPMTQNDSKHVMNLKYAAAGCMVKWSSDCFAM